MLACSVMGPDHSKLFTLAEVDRELEAVAEEYESIRKVPWEDAALLHQFIDRLPDDSPIAELFYELEAANTIICEELIKTEFEDPELKDLRAEIDYRRGILREFTVFVGVMQRFNHSTERALQGAVDEVLEQLEEDFRLPLDQNPHLPFLHDVTDRFCAHYDVPRHVLGRGDRPTD